MKQPGRTIRRKFAEYLQEIPAFAQEARWRLGSSSTLAHRSAIRDTVVCMYQRNGTAEVVRRHRQSDSRTARNRRGAPDCLSISVVGRVVLADIPFCRKLQGSIVRQRPATIVVVVLAAATAANSYDAAHDPLPRATGRVWHTTFRQFFLVLPRAPSSSSSLIIARDGATRVRERTSANRACDAHARTEGCARTQRIATRTHVQHARDAPTTSVWFLLLRERDRDRVCGKRGFQTATREGLSCEGLS